MVRNLTKDDLSRVPETINFPNEEVNILKYWHDEKIFELCLKLSKGKPRYTFYDGPPFATGLPHYGHILAGTIKDVVTRYACQQGYHVERRFGWDCHGLPVEYEIDKTLNITGPKDVEKMGIKQYNNECRKIVMRYATEWEEIVLRMGRWIDFRNDYKTLYPWYMETIWWVFKQLYEKGLVYQGVKVMPYSTACTTSLSNFESGQNYKEVIDPCVMVELSCLTKTDMNFLIWTTTPWTLPSNLSICVNPNLQYCKIYDKLKKKHYILAECRLQYVYKNDDDYDTVEKFLGKTLENLKYKPIFNYFEKYGSDMNAFRILCDQYVTDDSGTGIVHQAPYFGEDDYRVCLQGGIITKSSKIICPVDDTGCFTDDVKDFTGQFVKDADKNIIQYLKDNHMLFNLSQIKHSYPFCWRSDTPLLYKAVPSWFIRVEHMSKNLLSCSSQTYWVPEFVKEKRFGNWLKEARDWAVSRNRYWGTPIPIWKSDDNEEYVCIGSIKELEELSGVKINDLHRESIDHIEIPSKRLNGKPLKRIKEVFDCWFESGSMPFAQQHYPFENEKDFQQSFPADFIAEGIDQTRGWFYTLLVISTALFNKPPFKNLIANGLVLASDGQKMSKRKKNYPDPMEVVNKYGADALRLYLINSPVVRAENLRFKEDGVRDIIKDVFLPWYNSYRFLLQNIIRLNNEDNYNYKYNNERYMKSYETNDITIMDQWIITFKESLLEFIIKEMKAYRLYTVVPRLTKFIDQLTNWYVRLNRRRIKGDFGKYECIKSIDTLYNILITMCKMMAPFTPFLSEYIYQRLILLSDIKNDVNNIMSVHFEQMPIPNQKYIRNDIEIAVQRMQSCIELGRVIRDRRTLPIKYPLSEIIIIHKNHEYLNDIENLKDFILNELNIRSLKTSMDKKKYGITLRAEPDHKILGHRLKNDYKICIKKIQQLTDTDIQNGIEMNYFMINNNRIELNELRIIYCISTDLIEKYETNSDNDVLILIDIQQPQELIDEGLAREIINRIQKLKKKAKLIPTDQVLIYYKFISENQEKNVILKQFENVLEKHLDLIQTTIKSKLISIKNDIIIDTCLIDEEFDLKGIKLYLKITQIQNDCDLVENNKKPFKKWCNLQLNCKEFNKTGENNFASLFLNDKTNNNKLINLNKLKMEIELIYNLYGQKFVLTIDNKIELDEIDDNICGKTIFITKNLNNSEEIQQFTKPLMKFINIEFKNNEKSSIFLENPKGRKLFPSDLDLKMIIQNFFYPNENDFKLF